MSLRGIVALGLGLSAISALWAGAYGGASEPPAVALATMATASTPAPALARVSIVETEAVTPPQAFTRLCELSPALCAERYTAPELDRMGRAMTTMFGADSVRPQLPALTEARQRQLDEVNRAVNATIEPIVDTGGDEWRFTSFAGDCEEYVLMKREMLARLGWPRSSLRITVVHDGVGYHAVLVVETEDGALVLDNMVNHITRIEDSPYQLVIAQSARQPGAWTRIHLVR